MSAPVTSDAKALREYLVRLAMQAVVLAHEENRREGVLSEQCERHLRERLAQAAQTIVCEVAEIEADRESLRDAVERELVTHDGDPADRFGDGAMERLRAAVVLR